MAVNTAGTYRLEDPTMQIDTGGTPVDVKIAAEEIVVEPENHYADHPRTGGGPPYSEYIDSTWVVRLRYANGFGADGMHTALEALVGTEVDCLVETKDGVVSADFPTFAFTTRVPAVGFGGEIGEFDAGREIEFHVIGTPVKATA